MLAGSCAYAIADTATWRDASLSYSGSRAPQFYAGLNAVKMLFWSAVVNGVLAPPLVVLVVLLSSDRKVMGERINFLTANILGWVCAAVMTVAAVAMLIT